ETPQIPEFSSQLRAQGYAAAEVLSRVLTLSPDPAAASLVTTMAGLELETVCGRVRFSAPGNLSRQNPMPLCLISRDHRGNRHQLFPPADLPSPAAAPLSR
ncbi:MAG: hypothetical protein JXR89_09115, partial [Deltaproteobacteria bacterium]|nr:hypothetical protein [Deltaproteobacteria bacterium]